MPKKYCREVNRQLGQVSAFPGWERIPFWSQQPCGVALVQASSREAKERLALRGMRTCTPVGVGAPCEAAFGTPPLLAPPHPHFYWHLWKPTPLVYNTSGMCLRACALGFTKMTTEPGSLQNEQITTNFKSVFQSNEGLKVPICEVGSFKFQSFLSFLCAQKRSLFWKWKKYGFFFFLINSEVVELI